MSFHSNISNKAGGDLMSGEQVAKRLGVHSRTIYRWMDKGNFPQSIRIGHQHRWRQSDIEAWLEGGGHAETTGDC